MVRDRDAQPIRLAALSHGFQPYIDKVTLDLKGGQESS